MTPKLWAACLALLALSLAGCTSAPQTLPGLGESYASLGFDGTTWPALPGQTVTILAYDAFSFAFDEAKPAFENLTRAKVELLTADDAGEVLERAIREKGSPTFDVIYGVDNVLLGKATREGVFDAYEPLLGSRTDPRYAFVRGAATPVTHGYIAVNIDPRANLTVRTLRDLVDHASEFVTEDPRTSTPGLGFLVATVATFGEVDPERYDYIDYWNELFEGGVLVTSTWTEAYAQHFTGGYGQFEEGASLDRPIVTSYTTSPAYEVFYGNEVLNENLLAPKATFHQIQTMGIAQGAKHRAAAQAWIEFALTDAFQQLAAKHEAIYPVVANLSTQEVFQGHDPAPGSFEDAGFTAEQLDQNVERWLRAWTDAYDRSRS